MLDSILVPTWAVKPLMLLQTQPDPVFWMFSEVLLWKQQKTQSNRCFCIVLLPLPNVCLSLSILPSGHLSLTGFWWSRIEHRPRICAATVFMTPGPGKAQLLRLVPAGLWEIPAMPWLFHVVFFGGEQTGKPWVYGTRCTFSYFEIGRIMDMMALQIYTVRWVSMRHTSLSIKLICQWISRFCKWGFANDETNKKHIQQWSLPS